MSPMTSSCKRSSAATYRSRARAACGAPVTQPIKTVQSRQRGALSFALGCLYALRNPASREQEERPEQIALECPAAFSILARWVSDWELASA
jgi:hypothetical protein